MKVNYTDEKTELQNEKWRELSAKLFNTDKPVAELEEYQDWLDEFSDVELLQYCESEKFRRFFEHWDEPNFRRLMPFFCS